MWAGAFSASQTPGPAREPPGPVNLRLSRKEPTYAYHYAPIRYTHKVSRQRADGTILFGWACRRNPANTRSASLGNRVVETFPAASHYLNWNLDRKSTRLN